MAEPQYIVNSAGDIEQVRSPVYTKWMTATNLDGAAAAISSVLTYLRSGDPSAREQVPDDQFRSGSALGFAASLFGWDWSKVVLQFGRFRHFPVYKTDAASHFIHVRAFNRGLATGFRLGQAFTDAARAAWLAAIRKLGNSNPNGGSVSSGGGMGPAGAHTPLGPILGLAATIQSNLIDGEPTTKASTLEQMQKLKNEMQKLAMMQAAMAAVINNMDQQAKEATRHLR